MAIRRLLISAFAILLTEFAATVPLCRAQDYVYDTGNPNYGVQYPVPDGYINVTNGNVHLTIPLGTFKQRGKLPPIRISLEYDSRIWQIVDNSGTYSWQPTNVSNSLAGWRLITGLETGALSYSDYISQYGSCGEGQQQLPTEETFTDFVWTDGEGTKHTFDATLTQALPIPCNPSPAPSSTSGWAIDSSGYSVMTVYDTNTGTVQPTVYDNQGNEVYPARMDPNGNTACYNGGTIVDSTGRTLLTTTANGNTTTYQVLKEGGGTNSYTVTTAPIAASTAFNESAVSEYNGTLTGIQSIGLPDGSSYTFSYDSEGYGELVAMWLPTTGQVAFAYINYFDSYQNVNRWISGEVEAGNGPGATFTPSVLTQCSSGEVGCQEQMTLVRPDGSTRVYTLTLNDGAWDGQTVTYQGNTYSAPIMTVVNNYNFTSYQCSSPSICTGAEYVAASCSQVILDDTNHTAQTLYTYNSPWTGRVNSVKEYDYALPGTMSCSTTATPTRETDYAYGYSVNGAPFVTEKAELFNGSPYSQTIYNYDSGGLGNLMSVVQGGVAGGPQATTSNGYDSNGMRTSATDPNNNTTTYTYTCGDLYLAKTTYPQTNGINHITQITPDCSSGLSLNTSDENSQPTTYGYDDLGRKSSVSYADGGQATYQYPSPNETVETRLVSSSVTATTTTTLDAFGRRSAVAHSDPAGVDTVTTTYDGDDRVLCVTNPERSTSSSTDGQTCLTYDGIDRPTVITQPDGNTIHVSYVGNLATVTDENLNPKGYTYDAFHDLTTVQEPNANGTLAWTTTYAYDAGGHLVSITQPGDGSGAPRDRTFTYDDLGRLQTAVTPETGTNGGAGTVSYTYDNNGNVKTVTSGRGTITYNYDARNRVTSKTGGSINYAYVYDIAAPGGGFTSQNPIGRLVEESNNVNAGELLSYDPMGRVAYEANCVPSNCSQTGNAVYAAYDYAGDLASLTYPDGRVVTQGFDAALHLTSIAYSSWNGQGQGMNYLSSTAYAPTGQMTASTYGNGIQMSAGFNARQAIAALTYQNASQALWSKQYVWANNARNLMQVNDQLSSAQDYSYTYDPDNRLTSSRGGAPVLLDPATPGTGTVNIQGSENSGEFCDDSGRNCHYKYDQGTVTIMLNGTEDQVYYGRSSTPSTIASALATGLNNGGLVTATANNGILSMTTTATGASMNYSLSASSLTSDPTDFGDASFVAFPSGSSLTGGANAVYGGGTLSETYSPDSWGNVQESGTYNFNQSFTANNQVSGYTYDSAGDLTNDGLGNAYSYNIDGTLATTESAQYTYDALEQRVEKTGGSDPAEFVYFNGRPVAMLNPTSGTWTDLIWAGNGMIAEVAGSESAVPVYRLLDHENSLAATADGSGNITGTTVYTPYGEVLASNTSDPYMYAGLYQDQEYGGYHAWYRDFSTEQIRWITPDPYNGSYDLMNPQSFNRYSYVNNNPLGYADPSGLVDGWANGLGGGPCSSASGTIGSFQFSSIKIGLPDGASFNPCAPLASVLSDGIYYGLIATGVIDASSQLFRDLSPWIGFGISFACDFDSGSNACGQKDWTSVFIGGTPGKAVSNSISGTGAIFASMCAASGGWACPVSLGFAIYTAFDDLFAVLWDQFGQPQFHGTLLPRGTDEGGLGTSALGIPNQNLTVKDLLQTVPANQTGYYGLNPTANLKIGPARQ